MKIHFDNVQSFGTGPGTFANVLAVDLWNSGHELVDSGPDADVSLVFIERTGKPLAKKVVQRLDGIWFKPHEFVIKNVGIKHLYETADAVVWQSRFDRMMSVRHFGVRDIPARLYGDTHVVINNGTNATPVKELTIPKLLEMQSTYDKIFVCSSNWHAQKRLEANVRLFEHIRSTLHPNSCLIILGKNPDYRATGPHVFYAGHVGPDVYNEIYSAANWMIHLAWADHCPNVVVEALAQGTPVICSEVGGTQELIGNGAYGIVLKEQPYDYELADYDNPPVIDVTQVTHLPTRQELDYSGILNIDIRHVTDQYVRLFESLIRQ